MDKIELNDLLVCAFRYAIGRKTYVVPTIADLLLKYKDILSETSKAQIIRDINRAVKTANYGMDTDKNIWLRVRTGLEGY